MISLPNMKYWPEIINQTDFLAVLNLYVSNTKYCPISEQEVNKF